MLKAEGLVAPQPHKRPRSSYVRFCAELPNELWQSDITCWREVEIISVIDDHSRLCMAAKAFAQVRAPDVVSTFYEAASRHGLPESLLSDNGAVYTAAPRNGRCAIESELIALGILYKHSRPYHPQTCGKVERFHQTLKKHLAAQRPARSLQRLQAQIDRFIAYYNEERPHRALQRRTPAEAYAARIKAEPRATVTHQRATTGSATTKSTPAAPSRCAIAAACATSPWGGRTRAAAWSYWSPIATCACSAPRARSCASWCSTPAASTSRLASSPVYDVSRHLSPMS